MLQGLVDVLVTRQRLRDSLQHGHLGREQRAPLADTRVQRDLTFELPHHPADVIFLHVVSRRACLNGAGLGAETRAQRFEDFTQLGRAEHEVVRTCFSRELPVRLLDVAVRRQDHRDLRERRIFLHLEAETKAVEARHEDVGQDRVRARPAYLLEGLAAVCSRNDLEADPLHPEAHELALNGIIVSDHQASPLPHEIDARFLPGRQVGANNLHESRRLDRLADEIIKTRR